ncbi:NUMOD3 domain-containing DNA-binding protein [Bradyrhizobium sp. UFLA05-109]
MADVECVVYWLFDERCVCLLRHGYIGITSNWTKRLQRHRRNGTFPVGFGWKVLFRGPKSVCRKLEWQLRPTRSIGWNRTAGGGLARLGYRATETAKQNMREAAKGRPPVSDETRDKLRQRMIGTTNRGRIGQQKSDEERAKIVAATKGKPKSDEHRRKMSARMIGNEIHLGRSHSDDTKQLIGKKTGIPIHSEEEKRKRAERWKGNGLTKGQPWSAARRLAWLRSKEA